jgi:2-polyprenyl-3-methyl-5-hydroxy-6-metoxy-1,4-benzoquinol methylase
LHVHLVDDNEKYAAQDGEFDICVLDNVLEHIAEPAFVLQECTRITHKNAGLIIAVPGEKGFRPDVDHKKHYEEAELKKLKPRLATDKNIFTPFVVKSRLLSTLTSQYCLVAVYKKR